MPLYLPLDGQLEEADLALEPPAADPYSLIENLGESLVHPFPPPILFMNIIAPRGFTVMNINHKERAFSTC